MAALLRLALVVLLAGPAAAFRPLSGLDFAVFGNTETKALIRAWSPNPVNAPSGSVMLPSSTENMKRFVRARILLEEQGTGSIATLVDGALSVIICRFGADEHQMLLPLWQPNTNADRAFRGLREWHAERLGHRRLSGALLEDPGDRRAWREAGM